MPDKKLPQQSPQYLHPADLRRELRVGDHTARKIARLIGVRAAGGRRLLITREKLDAYKADPVNNNLLVMNRDLYVFQVPCDIIQTPKE